MAIERLLCEQTIGETRWVALDRRGEPAALYLDRLHDTARRAILGERLEARVRARDAATGGAFVDLGAKGEGFLRLKPAEALAEGARMHVEVASEARRGKLARVRLAAPREAASGVERWRASINGGATAPVDMRAAGDAEIQAAFDDALAARVVLPGGGRLQVERTEALVAADIDTAGRTARGGRAAAALAINREAAEALARQLHLRSWGGLAVLDCVGPLGKAAGAEVRTAFLEAFREISDRQVKALAPSAFGLMEISADWQTAPMSERMLDALGQPLPETAALDGLRRLEAEARASRMARLALSLPPAAFEWLRRSDLDAEVQLAKTYGARLTIAPGGGDRAKVEVM